MNTKDFYKKNKQYIFIIASLILGLILGGWMFGSSPTKDNRNAQKDDNKTEAHQEHQLWTCAMHPQIRQEEPGQCPICGMDLIPVKKNNSSEKMDPDAVMLSDAAIKLAQVQTYKVRKAIPKRQVELSGTVEFDETQQAKMTARFKGRIEKLFANFTGQYISKGQKIAEIYSPDLIVAQQELWDAAKYKQTNPALYRAARQKLKLWELSDSQINTLERMKQPATSFPILSPVSGYIQKLPVAKGDYVKEGQVLFTLTPLNQVWVMLDAYEPDLPMIKIGDKVNFSVKAIPGKMFKGKITYIDPFVNKQTRVAKVRVSIKNKDLLLKPGMFVSAGIQDEISKNPQLIIPKTAVLWTGKRSVVYVKKANMFKYREIILGPEAGDFYVVLKGLEPGEEIVSHAVFKVDAAAQLLGKPSMMNPEGGKTNTMPGMDMGDQ